MVLTGVEGFEDQQWCRRVSRYNQTEFALGLENHCLKLNLDETRSGALDYSTALQRYMELAGGAAKIVSLQKWILREVVRARLPIFRLSLRLEFCYAGTGYRRYFKADW